MAGNRPQSSSSNIAYQLATQMLERLLQAAAETLRSRDDAVDELDLAIPKTEPIVRLAVDKAAYAIRLAYCLAPHFPTLKDMVKTKAFVAITCTNGDEEEAVGKVLAEAAAQDAGGMALNPSYRLNKFNRFVVLADSTAYFSSDDLRAIATAGTLGYPVFCVVPCAAKLPDALAGVDLALNLPDFTAEMLELLFGACHDEVPADVLQFSAAEKLRTDDLIAHVRRARSATECLQGLQRVGAGRRASIARGAVLLKDLAGYGDAKTWGLELAQDLELWRTGQLSWAEVDHRAVVLAGPPGTGKTSFAAVLTATLEVPLIATSVAEWGAHNHLSGTLRRMQAVFDEASAKAPCVLFIDELDGISSRSAIEERYSEYWTQIINRMLELTTEALGKEGVVIVGATNHPDRIDPALTRSGRLDQIIHIPLPDRDTITAILKRYAGTMISTKDLQALAPRLAGKTGADIEALVRAAKASARRAGHSFSIQDLQQQVPDPLHSLPLQVQRRIRVYRNGQRVVAQVLGLAEMVPDQHPHLGQLLAKAVHQERFPTEQMCNDILAIIMAGRASEEIVFGDVSVFGSGVSESDLAVATTIAKDLEMRAGFR